MITIVTRAVRPHLGLVENHAGEITWIRAWEYHAGLRAGQTLRDYELESLRIDPVVGMNRLPRVALIPMTTNAYLHAAENGLAARYPRRDNLARNERDRRLRPRVHMMIANPQIFQ